MIHCLTNVTGAARIVGVVWYVCEFLTGFTTCLKFLEWANIASQGRTAKNGAQGKIVFRGFCAVSNFFSDKDLVIFSYIFLPRTFEFLALKPPNPPPES